MKNWRGGGVVKGENGTPVFGRKMQKCYQKVTKMSPLLQRFSIRDIYRKVSSNQYQLWCPLRGGCLFFKMVEYMFVFVRMVTAPMRDRDKLLARPHGLQADYRGFFKRVFGRN
jgi:hypothetical protein